MTPGLVTAYALSGRRCLAVAGADAFEEPSRRPDLDDLQAAIAAALDDPLESATLTELARGAALGGCGRTRLEPRLPRRRRCCRRSSNASPQPGCATTGSASWWAAACIAPPLPTNGPSWWAPRWPRACGSSMRRDWSRTSVHLGTTSGGCPVCIDDTVARADLVVAVGIVEPHLYAGFSGGVKAVAIGCAGHETIAWTHHPVFLDQPAVRLCRLDGNPFQEALREIAAHTRLRFALNVVVNDGGGVAGLAAGDPVAVQRRLALEHGTSWVRRHERPFDLVWPACRRPRTESLPGLADGHLCGAGRPSGRHRRRPHRLLRRPAAGRRRRSRRDQLRRPAGHRAAPRSRRPRLRRAARSRWAARLMMAKLMTSCRVGVVGGGDRALIESLGMLAFASVDEALAAARRTRGPEARTLAIADGLDTIVELADQAP